MNEIKTKSLKDTLALINRNLLSLYYTLGFPRIEDAELIFAAIEKTGQVDFIELGMPYSDPLADGSTIQKTSSVALNNGITFSKYFELATELKLKCDIPIVFMGYLNPVMQYGIENFCKSCNDSGIEGVIIPDLPVDIYEKDFKNLFEAHNLLISFLITPTTSEERIFKIADQTTGFIYVVSSNSITGKKNGSSADQNNYFKKIQQLNLNQPTMIGFGIHDKKSFENACKYANGAIIGSAFLRTLDTENIDQSISTFIHSIKS